MIPEIVQQKHALTSLLPLWIVFFFIFIVPRNSNDQLQSRLTNNPAVDGEMAFCTIKVDNVQKKGRRLVTTNPDETNEQHIYNGFERRYISDRCTWCSFKHTPSKNKVYVYFGKS